MFTCHHIGDTERVSPRLLREPFGNLVEITHWIIVLPRRLKLFIVYVTRYNSFDANISIRCIDTPNCIINQTHANISVRGHPRTNRSRPALKQKRDLVDLCGWQLIMENGTDKTPVIKPKSLNIISLRYDWVEIFSSANTILHCECFISHQHDRLSL